MTNGIQIKKVKTSAKASMSFGFAFFFLLFALGGAWAYYTELSGAIIAQGKVALRGKPQDVQHLDGGIITLIHVENGVSVSKGEELLRLDDKLLRANLEIYNNRLQERLARRDRLIAERDGEKQINWDESLFAIFNLQPSQNVREGQLRLLKARRKTIDGQKTQLRQKIAQYYNQMNGINALIASNNTQLGFIEEELSGVRQLHNKGLLPKSQLMALERSKESLFGQNAEHSSELAGIQNAISENEIAILQIEREFSQSVLTELREVEEELNTVIQQLHSTREELGRVSVKAPTAGIVHDMSVFTIGGVVNPSDTILQIIPQDDHFEVEARVEPQFVDQLIVGQAAALRFSAFNKRTTPELDGTVRTISANSIEDKQSGTSYYKINISISEQELKRIEHLDIIPGMPVEAFIKTQTRTALSYLTKPLMDQIQRAMREE
jgi:HlyD family secretion protein